MKHSHMLPRRNAQTHRKPEVMGGHLCRQVTTVGLMGCLKVSTTLQHRPRGLWGGFVMLCHRLCPFGTAFACLRGYGARRMGVFLGEAQPLWTRHGTFVMVCLDADDAVFDSCRCFDSGLCDSG